MTLEELVNDLNYAIVFGEETCCSCHTNPEGVHRADVVEILHEWHVAGLSYADWTGGLVGRLADGRFVAATGWSDSSGWG